MSKTVLFQTFQFSKTTQFSSIWPYEVLQFWVRVNLGAMVMKGYSLFPKAPSILEPHQQIFLYYIQNTCWKSLTPLQKSSRCILQFQPTEQYTKSFQIIQFSIGAQFSSFRPVDRALSDATTLGQSEAGNNDIEGLLPITPNSSISEASPSDSLCHIRTLVRGSYTSAWK